MAATPTDQSLAGIVTSDNNPAIIAATSPDILSVLTSPTSALPLGSFDTWRAIQEGDPDTAAILHFKKSGDSPRKKTTNPAVNRFFAASSVKNGVLIVPYLDRKTMRTVDKIVVPPTHLPTLLTIIHVKCNHPSRYQMDQIIQRYFFTPPGLTNKLSSLYEQCFTCQSVQKLKPSSVYAPPQSPSHPGSHLQADVLRHERQLILVITDLFSNFTTSAFVASEQKQDLINSLIQTTTPIRRAANIQIRTDRAPALQALARNKDPDLLQIGIQIILPDTSHNKNSNAKFDKILQELHTEIRKIVPQSRPLTNADLAQATSALDNRIRKAGFTAGEIQFARDFADNSNLNISDSAIHQSNLVDRPPPTFPANVPPPALATWSLSRKIFTRWTPTSPSLSPTQAPPTPSSAKSSTLNPQHPFPPNFLPSPSESRTQTSTPFPPSYQKPQPLPSLFPPSPTNPHLPHHPLYTHGHHAPHPLNPTLTRIHPMIFRSLQKVNPTSLHFLPPSNSSNKSAH